MYIAFTTHVHHVSSVVVLFPLVVPSYTVYNASECKERLIVDLAFVLWIFKFAFIVAVAWRLF